MAYRHRRRLTAPTHGLVGPTAHQTSAEPALFEIISTNPETEFEYRFSVDGTAERATGRRDDVTSVDESNDSIIVRDDGTILVTGRTGFEKGDAWSLTGRLLHFEITNGPNDYALFLEGEDVTGDPTGPVVERDPPEIPQPTSDTCEAHIMAAQNYAEAVRAFPDQSCSVGSQELQCPMPGSDGETRTYLARDGCEVAALRSYGWTQPTTPPDDGNGGGNGNGNGGGGGVDNRAAAGLGLVAVAGLAYVLS